MGWNPGRYTGYRERHMNQRSRGGYINLLKFVLCLERPKYIKKKSEVPTWWTSLKEIVGCGSVVSILASNIFIPVQLPPPPPLCGPHLRNKNQFIPSTLAGYYLYFFLFLFPHFQCQSLFCPSSNAFEKLVYSPKWYPMFPPTPLTHLLDIHFLSAATDEGTMDTFATHTEMDVVGGNI